MRRGHRLRPARGELLGSLSRLHRNRRPRRDGRQDAAARARARRALPRAPRRRDPRDPRRDARQPRHRGGSRHLAHPGGRPGPDALDRGCIVPRDGRVDPGARQARRRRGPRRALRRLRHDVRVLLPGRDGRQDSDRHGRARRALRLGGRRRRRDHARDDAGQRAGGVARRPPAAARADPGGARRGRGAVRRPGCRGAHRSAHELRIRKKENKMNLGILREFFARFLHARGMTRHFRRRGILEARKGTIAPREIPRGLARTLLDASRSEPQPLLDRLGSHPDGLTETQAEAIREAVGTNEVEHEKPLPWWAHLWSCYANPFNLLLTLLAAISYYTEDTKATVVITTMVVLSTLIRFVQESRSNRAADRLKEMVSNTATVLRHDPAQDAAEEARRYFGALLHPNGPRKTEVPIKLLVPGDVVLLSAGDMIPADLRLLSAKDLFVSQAAMTGESLPVEKFSAQREPGGANPLELENIVFMGTNVVSGSATAVVVTTGNHTYFGALAERVTAANPGVTAFQAGVNKVSWLLIRFMLVMSPVVLLINGFTKGDWVEAFLFALSIAVGLTPEMLPMIVTATLAKGAVLLSRKKVIVKRLDAIQNFGAMDVLCADKT